MKKLLSIALALVMLCSFSISALAANTTTLTTTVPAATYTLNIPEDQVIEFGEEETLINAPTITNASGFAVGKNVRVEFTYEPFTCAEVSTTIPYSLSYKNYDGETYTFPTDAFIFEGNTLGNVGRAYAAHAEKNIPHNATYHVTNMIIKITSTNWGKALAGDYTATITFTAEVVSAS